MNRDMDKDKYKEINNSEIYSQAKGVASEIIHVAKLRKGQILVVGCSTSEVCGDKIGTNSSPDVARAIFGGIYDACNESGIYVATQCCEHLNRAIIIEAEAVPGAEIVNVVPYPKKDESITNENKKLEVFFSSFSLKISSHIPLSFDALASISLS